MNEREMTEAGARRGGLPNGQCSKGWGNRCAASKGRSCRCACGGANHGKAHGHPSLGAANNTGMEDRGARFSIESDGGALVLRDLGPWDQRPTITNDVEGVVARVVDRLRGRRLFYIDSTNVLDEIVVRDGRFERFAPGAPESVRMACGEIVAA